MKKKILITGGAGYIGSMLFPVLAGAGYSVTVLDLSGPHGAASVHWVRGDARDTGLMRRLITSHDLLVPLAAVVGAGACDQDPETARTTNREAIRLLNRLRSKDQRVIYPMTNSVYRPKSDTVNVMEDCPVAGQSLYAQTKLDAEYDLLEKGNVTSLRFASAFGVSPAMRWSLLLNYFVKTAYESGEITLFEKDFKRNFVHVADAANSFLHMIEKCAGVSGVFNVGEDAANFTKEDLVRKIKDYFPTLRVVPLASVRDPDERNFFISSEKLKALGFRTQHTVDEGIQELQAECPKYFATKQ